MPGAIEFGRPGRGSNHMMPLLIRMPVCGETTLLPNSESSVWVRLDHRAGAIDHREMRGAAGIAGSSTSPIVASRRS